MVSDAGKRFLVTRQPETAVLAAGFDATGHTDLHSDIARVKRLHVDERKWVKVWLFDVRIIFIELFFGNTPDGNRAEFIFAKFF